jgi:hypothetical protein
MTTLGEHVYRELGEPDELDLYVVGTLPGKDEYDQIQDALEEFYEEGVGADSTLDVDVDEYVVSKWPDERADIHNDVFNLDVEDERTSLLVTPYTNCLSSDNGHDSTTSDRPIPKYKRFTRMTDDRLDASLHFNVQDDLEGYNGEAHYINATQFANELMVAVEGDVQFINEDLIFYRDPSYEPVLHEA